MQADEGEGGEGAEGELGGGRVSQASWPRRAGKELAFYSKIKGVTVGISWYHPICILNAYSGVCIESGVTQELGTLQALEIRNPHSKCHRAPKATRPVQH